MKIELLNSELKVFSRSISALSKLGEIIFFLWKDKLSLRTVNISKSGYVNVTFNDSFFHKFNKLTHSKTFKISSKALQKIFYCNAFLEKNVHRCLITLNDELTFLCVKFICSHDLNRSFQIPLTDCNKNVEAVYSIENSKNHLTIPVKVYNEVLDVFKHNADEITMNLCEEECQLRNAVDFMHDSKVIETNVKIELDEFSRYEIVEAGDFTFSLKELKIILSLSDYICQSINIHTQEPGLPVIFSATDNCLYYIHLVLATSNLHGSSQMIPTQTKKQAPSKEKAKKTSLKRPTPESADPVILVEETPDYPTTQLEINFFDDQNEPKENQGQSPIYESPVDPIFTQSQSNDPNATHTPPVKRAKSILFEYVKLKESGMDASVILDETCLNNKCPSPDYPDPSHSRILVPDSDPED